MSRKKSLVVAVVLVAVAVLFGTCTTSQAAPVITDAERLSELMQRVPVAQWDGFVVQFTYENHEYVLSESRVLSRGYLVLLRVGGEWFTENNRDAEFSTLITKIGRRFSAGLVEHFPARAYNVVLWVGDGDDARIQRNWQRIPILLSMLRGEFAIDWVMVDVPDGAKLQAPFTEELRIP